MRKGGGTAKGAAFERRMGTALSLWLTEGARSDIFRRNILSGGRFTIVSQQGGSERGQPGDLSAASPLAFEFLKLFLVECKHYADIGLSQYLLDTSGKSFLATVLTKARHEAKQDRLFPLVIACQNNRQPIILMDAIIAKVVLRCVPPKFVGALNYHLLHSETVGIMYLEPLTSLVKPDKFVASVRLIHTGNRTP